MAEQPPAPNPGEDFASFAARNGAATPAAQGGGPATTDAWLLDLAQRYNIDGAYVSRLGGNVFDDRLPGHTSTNAREAERTGGRGASTSHPALLQIGMIIQNLEGMSIVARRELQRRLVVAGNLPQNTKITGALDDQFVKGFLDLLTESERENRSTKADGNQGTWQDFLDRKMQSAQAGEGPGGGGGGTQTQTSLRKFTEGDARAALFTMFKSMIGREPNQQEIEAFTAPLNKKAAASPSVTRQTSDAEGNMVTESTGGFDGDQVALEGMDYIRQNNRPEYDSYQSVSKYFPAIERAISGVGSSSFMGGR